MKTKALLLAVCLSLRWNAAMAQTGPRIVWDEDPTSLVLGYAITVDGVRVDYFRTPVGPDLTCGCSIVPPFSGGRHVVVVSAYNFSGEVQSSELVVAPTAHAGGPYTALAGSAIVADASRSAAPTGTFVMFQWNWGDGTSSTSSSRFASHAYSSSGTYTIQLLATDNAGAIAVATATASIAAAPVNPTGYGYRRTIAVDHTKVANSDQANFTLLFSGTYASLATVDHGGQVQSPKGYDIIFTSDAAGNIPLDHEIESYDPNTGAVSLWVRVPTVSHTSDSVIYLWYGNSAITKSQENTAGVWDSHFEAVYHLSDRAASSAVKDSTNAATGTNSATTAARSVTGQVGGALNGDGIADFTDSGRPMAMGTSSLTISAWVKVPATPRLADYATIVGDGGYTTSAVGYWFFVDAESGRLRAAVSDGQDRALGSGRGPDLRDGAWHSVAVVYDRAGAMTTYVDGVATEAIDISAFAGTSIESDTNVIIGRSRWSASMTGALDEVRLSNTARSQDLILTEYDNQRSPATFYTLGPATVPQ
jgi:PKD repeat protein